MNRKISKIPWAENCFANGVGVEEAEKTSAGTAKCLPGVTNLFTVEREATRFGTAILEES